MSKLLLLFRHSIPSIVLSTSCKKTFVLFQVPAESCVLLMGKRLCHSFCALHTYSSFSLLSLIVNFIAMPSLFSQPLSCNFTEIFFQVLTLCAPISQHLCHEQFTSCVINILSIGNPLQLPQPIPNSHFPREAQGLLHLTKLLVTIETWLHSSCAS